MLEPAVDRPLPSLDLDALGRLGAGALVRLYRHARAPRSLADLAKTERGRLLALAPPFDRAQPLLRKLASSPLFPWLGKRFDAHGDVVGEGKNRFKLLGELGAFRVRYGGSVLDSERCAVLDYDLPENPAPLRLVMDELREVRPGLFFGPAFVRTRTEPKLVLFFAVQGPN